MLVTRLRPPRRSRSRLGSVRNPNFWRTPDQRGDALVRAGKFSAAAKAYANPWRVGVAQYRNGDFEAAAKTFARVPGATGAFDQGNAWLMHGQYDAAVASYDRALGFHPGWKEAEENKALALARKAKIEASGRIATKSRQRRRSPMTLSLIKRATTSRASRSNSPAAKCQMKRHARRGCAGCRPHRQISSARSSPTRRRAQNSRHRRRANNETVDFPYSSSFSYSSLVLVGV